MSEGKAQSTFYIITHTFKAGCASKFWNAMKSMTPEILQKMIEEQQVPKGFYNHTMIPTGPAGPTFCIWECAPGKTAEDLQAYIDDPSSPAGGAMNNTVTKIDLSLAMAPPYPRKFK